MTMVTVLPMRMTYAQTHQPDHLSILMDVHQAKSILTTMATMTTSMPSRPMVRNGLIKMATDMETIQLETCPMHSRVMAPNGLTKMEMAMETI
jgi:hypothetical protein